jgi:hypothetical protein
MHSPVPTDLIPDRPAALHATSDANKSSVENLCEDARNTHTQLSLIFLPPHTSIAAPRPSPIAFLVCPVSLLLKDWPGYKSIVASLSLQSLSDHHYCTDITVTPPPLLYYLRR